MRDQFPRVKVLVFLTTCLVLTGLAVTAFSGCRDEIPPGGISRSEAIAIAKDYIDQVDRGHTTTGPPGVSAPTMASIKIDITSADLGPPNELYMPTDKDLLVWTIKMDTSRASFPVIVCIDAMTGQVVGGRIW
jgi:hypothetical protein